MLKLFVTLVLFLALALGLLGLRMRRLELTAETARLRLDVERRQHQLWGQEDQIARQTNPPALAEGLHNSGLVLGPPIGGLARGRGATGASTGGGAGGRSDADRDLLAPVARTSRRHHPTATPGAGRGQ
ncbi:MAG: hypothetical protein WCI73_16115 [Phycisphaerae bacterium]